MHSSLHSRPLQHRYFYLLFAVVLSFVGVADSIMGYVAPLFIEQIVGNATLMGIVLATSSGAGVVVDFLFAKLFPDKTSRFFLTVLFMLVFLFPLAFLLFQSVSGAIFAMVVWGIYFEAMVFSNYHAIHETVPTGEHGWAWGTSSVLRNLSWSIGPLLATLLYQINVRFPLYAAIGAYAIGLLTANIFILLKRKHMRHSDKVKSEPRRGFIEELKIWKTYARVLWPLLFLTFLFYCVESAFFSVGPLLGESLKKIHPFGGLFVSMYSVPGIIVGFLVSPLSKPFGKKRLAFASGILSGLGLIAVALGQGVIPTLLFAFLASIGLCLIDPALAAVYEDFIARSGRTGNDIVGLTALVGSLAYIIGPIINGVVADQVGVQEAFGFWGMIMVGYSFLLFFIVARKIRLPQAQVNQVIESM